MVKIFSIIVLAVILQVCQRSSIDTDQKGFHNETLTNVLIFSDSIEFCNKRFYDAVTSYLKEPNSAGYKYFTLFLGQYKDTVISVLSPLWYDIGIERTSPAGVFLIEDKVIFITSSVLIVIRNKRSAQVQRMFDEAVISLSDRHPTKSRKPILFKLPIYTDTLIVSRDLNILNFYFMPEIHEDTLYNLPPDQ